MSTEEKKDITYWGDPHHDGLLHEGWAEAVDGAIERAFPVIPETVEVAIFDRARVAKLDSGTVLNSLLERLDEEFMHEDVNNGQHEATEAMLEAEREFLDAVVAEYTPTVFYPRKPETVNVQRFLSEGET